MVVSNEKKLLSFFWFISCNVGSINAMQKHCVTHRLLKLKISFTMKKCSSLLLFILFISLSVPAQNTITAGPELNAGGKQFEDAKKTGVGFSIEYLAKAFAKGGIRVYTAYNHFPHQYGNNKFNFIPLRAGYEHFIYSDNLFVYAEAGLANFLFSSGNHTGFSAAAGGGYKINMPKATLLQLSIFYNYNRFQSSVNYNWLTLRAAYGIKFGKRKAFKRED
jgi:hypothetical protein